MQQFPHLLLAAAQVTLQMKTSSISVVLERVGMQLKGFTHQLALSPHLTRPPQKNQSARTCCMWFAFQFIRVTSGSM
jgi:hypothetical protein